MSTPSGNVGQDIKATAAADVAKAQAWLGSNWYAFAIGAGSAAAVTKLAHLVGLLKFL